MTKRAFEEAIEKVGSLPIVDAASFFLSVRRFPAPPSSMDKTAGWQDPPDEEGILEGQFAAPVEHAVALMGKCAGHLMKLMMASLTYGQSIRGAYASEIKDALCSADWDHKSSYEFLVERMTVLAGPPHIPEPEAPPPSIQPIEVAKRMIRAEQEMIQCYRELSTVLGENPMAHKIQHCMMHCQEHLDRLWKACPPELCGDKTMNSNPAMLAAHEAEETPEDEALESPEFQQAEEAVGVEEPEQEVTAMAKTAMRKAAGDMPFGLMVGAPSKAMDIAYEQGLEPGFASTIGGTLGSMAGFRKGADVGRGMEGAVRGALGGGLGASGGATIGGLGGGLGGAALGAGGAALLGMNPLHGALLGGGAGALGGGLYGGYKGGTSGYDYMTRGIDQPKTAAAITTPEEMDAAVADQAMKGRLSAVQGAARAEAMSRHQRGERMGDVLGRIGGTAGGAALGSKLVGGPVGTIGGGALGYLAGGKLGKELGTEVDIAREKKAMAKMAARMVQRVKLAQEPMMAAEAPMSAPTDRPELQAPNYLMAEQMGQQAQHANEIQFFKSRAQKAMQEAQQAVMQSQQQAQQLEQQMGELQQQADSANQSIQASLSEAMQARDEALKQTQVAANMRMGMQKLRQQMFEVASQDPAAVAAAELDQVANQSREQAAQQAAEEQAAVAPDAGMMPPPGPEGPAGQAPPPATPPGAAPGAGSPDMNAPAGGPPGPGGEPSPESQMALKQSSVKLAGWLGAGAGAAIGGGMGLHQSASLAGANPQALRDQVQVLEQTQDGTYGRAAELAKARKTFADSQLAQGHPVGHGLRATAKGAALGAIRGSILEGAVNRGANAAAMMNYQQQLGKLKR